MVSLLGNIKSEKEWCGADFFCPPTKKKKKKKSEKE
jgi:hypothetical protein